MKKSCVYSAVMGLALLFGFTSCQTVNRDAFSNEIQSEKLVLNTYLDKSEYTVIGTAKGESDFVWWNDISKKFSGDSEKYGYISQREDSFIGENVYVGTGKKAADTESTEAFQRAKLNANYALIEEAYKMGGDEILEPIYTVEMHAVGTQETQKGYKGGRVQYKVTARAKVIQLKLK